ncbi:MAG: hypothetical protein BWY94_01537 [Actinobacteria bacterium ADurb.BinA094]|nr:MAG: hypothetical protein BWY94_01537 [Actinobacteria bacterium ADurb.BinA094]
MAVAFVRAGELAVIGGTAAREDPDRGPLVAAQVDIGGLPEVGVGVSRAAVHLLREVGELGAVADQVGVGLGAAASRIRGGDAAVPDALPALRRVRRQVDRARSDRRDDVGVSGIDTDDGAIKLARGRVQSHVHALGDTAGIPVTDGPGVHGRVAGLVLLDESGDVGAVGGILVVVPPEEEARLVVGGEDVHDCRRVARSGVLTCSRVVERCVSDHEHRFVRLCPLGEIAAQSSDLLAAVVPRHAPAVGLPEQEAVEVPGGHEAVVRTEAGVRGVVGRAGVVGVVTGRDHHRDLRPEDPVRGLPDLVVGTRGTRGADPVGVRGRRRVAAGVGVPGDDEHLRVEVAHLLEEQPQTRPVVGVPDVHVRHSADPGDVLVRPSVDDGLRRRRPHERGQHQEHEYADGDDPDAECFAAPARGSRTWIPETLERAHHRPPKPQERPRPSSPVGHAPDSVTHRGPRCPRARARPRRKAVRPPLAWQPDRPDVYRHQ